MAKPKKKKLVWRWSDVIGWYVPLRYQSKKQQMRASKRMRAACSAGALARGYPSRAACGPKAVRTLSKAEQGRAYIRYGFPRTWPRANPSARPNPTYEAHGFQVHVFQTGDDEWGWEVSIPVSSKAAVTMRDMGELGTVLAEGEGEPSQASAKREALASAYEQAIVCRKIARAKDEEQGAAEAAEAFDETFGNPRPSAMRGNPLSAREAYEAGFDRGRDSAMLTDWEHAEGYRSWWSKDKGAVRPGREHDAFDSLAEYAADAEDHSRQFTPWEHLAAEINRSRRPDARWADYDAGVGDGIQYGAIEVLGLADHPEFGILRGEILDRVKKRRQNPGSKLSRKARGRKPKSRNPSVRTLVSRALK